MTGDHESGCVLWRCAVISCLGGAIRWHTMTCKFDEFCAWNHGHRRDIAIDAIDVFLWHLVTTYISKENIFSPCRIWISFWFFRSSFWNPKPLPPVGLRFRKLLQGIVWLERFNLWMRPLCQGHQPTLWSCLGMPSMSIRLAVRRFFGWCQADLISVVGFS